MTLLFTNLKELLVAHQTMMVNIVMMEYNVNLWAAIDDYMMMTMGNQQY